MPGRAPPSASLIHTLASTRRTPSTNTTGAGPAGGGVIGAHCVGGRSTARSTVTSDSAIAALPSPAEPYSGAQVSTANLTARSAPPSTSAARG